MINLIVNLLVFIDTHTPSPHTSDVSIAMVTHPRRVCKVCDMALCTVRERRESQVGRAFAVPTFSSSRPSAHAHTHFSRVHRPTLKTHYSAHSGLKLVF